MAMVLTFAANLPVVKVGRIAGQFAKPRSDDSETRDGVTLPSYRGDNHQRRGVHAAEPRARSRAPDARLFPGGGDAQSAARVRDGRLCRSAHVPSVGSGLHREHRRPATALCRHRRHDLPKRSDFMRSLPLARCGQTCRNCAIDFYFSHEALLLGYEAALTRIDSITGDWYATAAHMLWIGDRTRQPDGAHVEFCRGIKNPLGLKCGPSMSEDDFRKLVADPQSRQQGGPPDPDLPLRRGQGCGETAAAHPRGEARRRQCRVVLRSDARQHHQIGHRLQDAAVRPHPEGGEDLLRRASRRRHLSPAACISR